MRIPSIAAALFSASWALISAPSPASAERVCIAITGQVDHVQDALGVMSGDIAPGAHFTGAYVYESTTPDTNSDTPFGVYSHTTAPFGITLNAGGIVFRTDPANVDFWMEMMNDNPGDNYLLRSRVNLFEKTLPSEDRNEIFWQLDDVTGTALGNTALSTEPPVLTDWPSSNFLFTGPRVPMATCSSQAM